MSPVALRAQWEVQAGLILRTVDPEYTRTFQLTNVEWESPDGLRLFMLRSAEAHAYADWLMLQRMVNWVETLFIWV